MRSKKAAGVLVRKLLGESVAGATAAQPEKTVDEVLRCAICREPVVQSVGQGETDALHAHWKREHDPEAQLASALDSGSEDHEETLP